MPRSSRLQQGPSSQSERLPFRTLGPRATNAPGCAKARIPASVVGSSAMGAGSWPGAVMVRAGRPRAGARWTRARSSQGGGRGTSLPLAASSSSMTGAPTSTAPEAARRRSSWSQGWTTGDRGAGTTCVTSSPKCPGSAPTTGRGSSGASRARVRETPSELPTSCTLSSSPHRNLRRT